MKKEVENTVTNELTDNDYLISLVMMVDTPIGRLKYHPDVVECVQKVKAALISGKKLQ